MSENGRETWDEYFMGLARNVAGRSKDRSSRIGAVIVGPDKEIRSTGYNGMPRGVDDDVEDRHERPVKYFYFEHAERNAIFNAARASIGTKGCRMYVCGLRPCADCARAIVQAGIVEVVLEGLDVVERWADSMEAGRFILEEAGVVVRMVNEIVTVDMESR